MTWGHAPDDRYPHLVVMPPNRRHNGIHNGRLEDERTRRRALDALEHLMEEWAASDRLDRRRRRYAAQIHGPRCWRSAAFGAFWALVGVAIGFALWRYLP